MIGDAQSGQRHFRVDARASDTSGHAAARSRDRIGRDLNIDSPHTVCNRDDATSAVGTATCRPRIGLLMRLARSPARPTIRAHDEHLPK